MMINDIYTKWKSLVTKNDGKLSISAFYVSKKCPSKLYLGFDGEKKYIFLEFNPSVLVSYKTPKAKGLEITIEDIPQINDADKYIKITNIDNNDEVFLAFCSTLYDMLKESLSYYDVTQSLEKTIKYYKAYFSNPNKPLSSEEEQGLYCELVYLERMINKCGSEAINHWEGPHKNKRDFVFQDKSIEIKSTTNQITTSIRISNELQLDSTYPEHINLYLKVFVLEKVDDGDSLTKIINRISSLLVDVEQKRVFLQKLLMNKIDVSLYEDIENYSVQKEHFYKVTKGFPAITKNEIDNRIYKVEYYLSLLGLDEYEVIE